MGYPGGSVAMGVEGSEEGRSHLSHQKPVGKRRLSWWHIQLLAALCWKAAPELGQNSSSGYCSHNMSIPNDDVTACTEDA